MQTSTTGRVLGLGLIIAVALATGCVTRGTYDELEAERAALEAKRSALAKERAALANRVTSLESANEELDAQVAAKAAQMREMQGTYDALVSDLQGELESGQVTIEQLRDGLQVSLAEAILFPSGSAELNDAGVAVLTKVATELAKVPHRIEVLGHTDSVQISRRLAARYPTNWELAAARASRVVRLFQEGGIEGKRLFAVSRGPFEPVATNDTKDGRAQNRRIEIRLIPIRLGAS